MFFSFPACVNFADFLWRSAPEAIFQHARILLQARLRPVLVPPAGGGPRARRRRSRTPQPGSGGGESPGPAADVQLGLLVGLGGTGDVLRGGGPRPPAVRCPEPPVAARRLGQRHSRAGRAVVVGGCDRTEKKERFVRGAAGRASGIAHRPGPLLHGWITLTQGHDLQFSLTFTVFKYDYRNESRINS